MFHESCTMKDVAELLEVDISTVWVWCNTGKLMHYKIGRNVKIPIEGLAEFIKRNPKYERRIS